MYESFNHTDTQARAKLPDSQIRPWAKADHVMEGLEDEEDY